MHRHSVTLVHKTNVLTYAGDLWSRVVDEVAAGFPGVATAYNHVDAACIYLATEPAGYDVIVTDNLFGDILSDLAGALTGGIGLAASANLNPERTGPSLFEPVHGAAHDIVGTGRGEPDRRHPFRGDDGGLPRRARGGSEDHQGGAGRAVRDGGTRITHDDDGDRRCRRRKVATMPLTPTEKIWMDGELVDWADAQIHVLTHSLHYGTGVFEGIRAYKTAKRSGRLPPRRPRLPLRPDGADADDEAALRRGRDLRGHQDDGARDRPRRLLHPADRLLRLRRPGHQPAHLRGPCRHRSLALGRLPRRRRHRGRRPGEGQLVGAQRPRSVPASAKATGTYINSTLAKVEALMAGYEEAVMCTTDGFLSECTGENLFIVRRGRLLTPAFSASVALEGVTAESVMTIARDLGYEVAEESLRRTDLYIAEEAFLTGTAAEVVPIASVDDRVIGDGTPGPMTRAIQEVFFKAVRGEVEQYKDWLDYVN